MDMKHEKDLSIIVSVYNEEASLSSFQLACQAVLVAMTEKSEIIYVNDGSTDASATILNQLAEDNQDVNVLHFTRNFGHEAAMIAGIDHARSGVCICLDADLQHPPSLIPDMYKKHREGHDVVTMARKEEKGGWSLKKLASRWFYKIMNKLAPIELIPNASDFFLVSGEVLRSIQSNFRERNRFLRGLIQFLARHPDTIYFEAAERQFGESKYSFRKLFNLSFVALVSFSKIPLHLGLVIGVLFGFFSIILALYSLVMYFMGTTPPGYTTLVLFISLAFSLQFIMIGIIGIYVGFTFDETKGRPIYLLKEDL